jgi:D-sedoheptulose 7-phosphate isomerase
MNTLEKRFNELQDLLLIFKDTAKGSIELAAQEISKTFIQGNKILICGNGGSAADSQHFAAEFVNKFSKQINRSALPALALTTDSSIITAISNDSNFDLVFSRQVEAYGKKGDLIVAFTTSGNSKNCINAVKASKLASMNSIVFTRTNAEISKIADLSIEVPSDNTQHIQECHIFAYHVISELVENSIYGYKNE